MVRTEMTMYCDICGNPFGISSSRNRLLLPNGKGALLVFSASDETVDICEMCGKRIQDAINVIKGELVTRNLHPL